MTDEDIAYLKRVVAEGSPYAAYWIESDYRYRRIISVGTHPDEPLPVGYVGNGDYIALAAVDSSDIRISLSRDLAIWPSAQE